MFVHWIKDSPLSLCQRCVTFFCALSVVLATNGGESRNALLFVGSYTQSTPHYLYGKGEGLYVFDLTIDGSGSLSLGRVTTIKNIVNPAYLEITKSKKYLYVISETETLEDGYIYAFQISWKNQEFKYQFLGSWPVGGVTAAQVSIDNADQFVFVSNYINGSVTAFKIDQSTGRLEKRNFHQFTGNSNVNKERQEMPHVHCTVIDDKLRFVYVTDLGNDCIWRMNYSPVTGFINETLTKFPAPPGSGPRHFALEPVAQKYLYVACELTNHLLVYWVNDDGSLQQTQYLPTTANTSGGTADVHVSPDGKFVYVSTRIIDIITVFQVQSDGQVKKIQEINCGGQMPRNFVLYPPFNLLLAGHQTSHSITAFRTEHNGELTGLITWFPINSPVCLKFFE